MYTFDKILGNEHIKNSLQTAVKTGKVSHAFIFSGAAGTGKKFIAYTLAKALNCKSGNAPCGECVSCRTFESGNNPDIISVRPKGKSIGIDDVREQITLKMQSKPYSGKYKVFVIEDADKLTVPAQNALLKTMEEPAQYGIFLLTSENYNTFLPTIISRAVVLNVCPLPAEIVSDYLVENYNAAKEEGDVLAAYSEGSIGKAAALFTDEEFKKLCLHFIELAEGVETGDASDAIYAAEQMANYKAKITDGLNALLLRYRDALVYKSTGRTDLMIGGFHSDHIKSYAEDETLIMITKRLQAVLKVKRQLFMNANARLALEVMLLDFLGGL